MSSLESNKNLAGIGTILLALGSIVPAAGAVLGIVGIILLMIGIKGLADNYNDRGIYQNALWGIVFVVIALISIAVAIGSLMWGGIFSGLAVATAPGVSLLAVGIIILILALIVAFIFYLLAAIYFRRVFSALAQKSGEHMFETAGLLLLIGAFLTIILVGLVLIFVAWLLAAVAFFSIKTPAQTYGYTPPPPTSPPPTSTTRYCPYCGAPVNANATFCPNCGKQLT